MELKCLINGKMKNKYVFSNIYVNPSRSPFIKEMICIKYEDESLDKILENIKKDRLYYDDFKVCYLRLEKNEVQYNDRLNSLKKIGMAINGEANMHSPKIMLGVTKVEGKWIFGEYKKNDFEWHIHERKPYEYSNALTIRVARALVNIAVGNNIDMKLIDPCCGVGTVVIEALSMGIDVAAYELNKNIAENAKRNIEFFGYDNVVTHGNMHDIKERYDVAIIDIPYGLFTPITHAEQIAIINTARKITKKLVLVAFEDMSECIKETGFTIEDLCHVCKGKFKRHIYICK
ncbi:MAG TPA: SAM-dependent methyltransferase [Clostridium sp.]|nr:SAM-dependent methyltransferase [Clostridium sp.]